jgi:hypothetical protein
VAVEVTHEGVGDTTMFPSPVEAAEGAAGPGRISQVLADGAYDSRADFQLLEGKGIRPGIRIKEGASCKSQGSMARPRAVQEFQALGYGAWREAHGYGLRWAAEWTFSAVKRIFGEAVRARRRDLMFTEVRTKFALYNLLLQVGRRGRREGQGGGGQGIIQHSRVDPGSLQRSPPP